MSSTKPPSTCSVIAAGILVTCACCASVQAQATAHQSTDKSSLGWFQFRGPGRDGISEERDLLGEWPPDGPPLIWRREGIGSGYSSPIITPDGIFITGDVGEDLVVICLSRDGKEKWRVKNGAAWKRPYPGARATCTYTGDNLVVMNGHGRLVCSDPKTGAEKWAVNVLERFAAPNIRWGLSECILVEGDRLYVSPGGPTAMTVALSMKDGSTLWATEPIRFTRMKKVGGKPLDEPREDTDRAGYASPIRMDIGGRRLLFSGSASHFFCVDVEARKLLWQQHIPVTWEVIGAIPVACGSERVLLTAPDFGASLYKVGFTNGELAMTELWHNDVDNCHGALLFDGMRILGSGYRTYKGWVALDLETGAKQCTLEGMPKGSTLLAEGRLYAFSEAGTLKLFEPQPDAFRECGSITLARGKTRNVWAHPVIWEGKLYLRQQNTLYCYDVKR